MPLVNTDKNRPKATPSEIREFFTPPKPTLQELKALKVNPQDYDDIAYGIGDGSLTY